MTLPTRTRPRFPHSHSLRSGSLHKLAMKNEPSSPPPSVDAQYATGEEQRNSPRRNEKAESKQKQRPVVNVSGGESKVQHCKEQYYIGNWNVRSMNLGKLEVVKRRWQE